MESTPDTTVLDKKTPEPTTPKRNNKLGKREPNEDIPPNWQRRPHVADRMPVLNLSDGVEIQEDGLRVASTSLETLSYAVGDFVFVACEFSAPPLHTPEDFGSAPPAFRIARIMQVNAEKTLVNWLVRPCEVFCSAKDSREVYLTFETSWISLELLRGKCVVQNVLEIRRLVKYREKSSQFWFNKLYSSTHRRKFDVVPTASLKSLGPRAVHELGMLATYVVVATTESKKLVEAPRKRKNAMDDSVADEIEQSEEEAREFLLKRLEWPFRSLDVHSKELLEPCIFPPHLLPRVREGEQFQVQVDHWPGRPLMYYTAMAPNSSTRLKFVEPLRGSDKVDKSQPWVQKMPQGYIPRGSDSTSTPVSLPSANLADFVQKCQQSYAESVEVSPHAVNFLDACCSILVNNAGGTLDDAFVTVSRLTRRLLREPDLNSHELSVFKSMLNPFKRMAWHEVFKAVGSKPVVELCQFYWVDLPKQPQLPASQIVWGGEDPEILSESEDEGGQSPEEKPQSAEVADDNNEDKNITTSVLCALCFTDEAMEWKSLPGFVPLFSRTELEHTKKIAMCGRCARLWYRYKTAWVSPLEIEPKLEEIEESSDWEPELIDDTKSYIAEKDRRSKRRTLAQEKKEAVAKKREEAKQAKRAAKEAKKLGKDAKRPATDELKTKLEEAKETNGTQNKENETETEKGKQTEKEKEKDTKNSNGERDIDSASATPEVAGTKKSKTKAKRKPRGKVKEEASTVAEEEDSEGETSDIEEDEQPKKRGGVAAASTRMSLDQVDEILDEIDAELEPETAEYSNYCAVCGQLDPSMPQETCCSCGLNVHLACYGATNTSMSSSANDGMPWLCDCCLNCRGEFKNNDNSYQCILCPQRVPVYGSWLNGGQHGAPDVLKNTLQKTWCHLRCAVFTPNVKFGDPGLYRDIDTSHIAAAQWEGTCKICVDSPAPPRTMVLYQAGAQAQAGGAVNNANTTTGDNTKDEQASAAAQRTALLQQAFHEQQALAGTKVKCEFCDDQFHVSCAADKGYRLGLTKESNPRAVIVCNKHSDVDLVPISKLDLNLNLSAMQMYVGTHKVSRRKFVEPSYRCAQTNHHITELVSGRAPQLLVPLSSKVVLSTGRQSLTPQKCSQCGNTDASYYHVVDSGVKCPLCFRRLRPQLNELEPGEAKALKVEIVNTVFNNMMLGGPNSMANELAVLSNNRRDD